MKKNTAGQYWDLFAYHANTGIPATGIAATITAMISLDDAAEASVGSGANPTELTKGRYRMPLTQGETNAYKLSLNPFSTANGVLVRALPETLTTETAAEVEPSTLTAQNVRDAMKLAPTAGDPAAGSLDKHLDDLVTAVAAVPTAGEIDTQLSGTHGAGTWESSGAGTGARAVVFTVTTGGVALLGASVRLYRTGSVDRTGTTNSSGQVTLYCDVDATWSYAVTHALYDAGSGTVVVDGNEAVPVALTAATWPASTVPGTTTVRWRVRKTNRAWAGTDDCTVYMGISKGPGVAGTIYNGDNLDYDSDATDASGYVYFANTPKGATVAVKTATDGQVQFVKIPADCGSTFDGLELIGSS